MKKLDEFLETTFQGINYDLTLKVNDGYYPIMFGTPEVIMSSVSTSLLYDSVVLEVTNWNEIIVELRE